MNTVTEDIPALNVVFLQLMALDVKKLREAQKQFVQSIIGFFCSITGVNGLPRLQNLHKKLVNS